MYYVNYTVKLDGQDLPGHYQAGPYVSMEVAQHHADDIRTYTGCTRVHIGVKRELERILVG